ncbi:MAG TPA: L,D-transpeptidase [Pyrinomonadaceae bacterium]|nr:L,D-transpeptidase [Pyrinomonadaceae bacterium]
MKIVFVTLLVAVGFLFCAGEPRSPARKAGGNSMPMEVQANAQGKPGETGATSSGGALPEVARSAPSPEVAQRAPLKLPLVNPRVVVSKSKRQLLLYAGGAGGAVVRTYRIALGANPVEDKVREGDGATPEGDFYVCVKNARSNFYLSLGLSYPNAEDAERGLRDKLITRAERDAIVRAIRNKRRPPWDTALGGEIFIHGGGTDGDWTRGCVALANEDIREVFDALPLGTPVRVEH